MRRKKLPKYVLVEDGEWYVRIYVRTEGRYAKGSPKYIQIKRKCDPQTQERVDEILTQIHSERTQVKPRAQSLQSYLDSYLDSRKQSVSQRVYESNVDYLERYIKSRRLSFISIDEITPRDIQDLYAEINRTPSVVKQLHKFLSGAFSQAVRWRDIPSNPCQGVLLPRVPHRDVRAFDEAQLRLFLAECRKTDNNIVLEFAAETGARPQEYLALTWNDLKGNKVTIKRAVVRGLKGGGYLFKEAKTRGSRRTFEITSELVERLKMMERTSDLIFPSEVGTPMSLNNLNTRKFKPIVKEIGLDPSEYSAYTLRHTSITLLLARGVDPKTVAERHGTSAEMLWKTYAHVLPAMRSMAVGQIREVLYG